MHMCWIVSDKVTPQYSKKNLSDCDLVRHKSHVHRPLRWQAGNQSPEPCHGHSAVIRIFYFIGSFSLSLSLSLSVRHIHNIRLCTSVCLSQYVGNYVKNYGIRIFSKKLYNVPGFMVRVGTTLCLRGYSASCLIAVAKASADLSSTL